MVTQGSYDNFDLQICPNHMNISANLYSKLDKLFPLVLLIKRIWSLNHPIQSFITRRFTGIILTVNILRDNTQITPYKLLACFLIYKPSLFYRPTLDRPRQTQLTECWPGAPCLNVVDSEMGGTTAWEVHCSGSWPTWMACVAKCWNLGRNPCGEASFSCMLSCEEKKE